MEGREIINSSLYRGLDEIAGDLSSLKDVLVTNLSALPEEEVMRCGSELLELFVQLNWTGPPCTPLPLLLSSEQLDGWNKLCLQTMQYNGESYYKLCRHPCLLYMAHVILVDQAHRLKLREGSVWKMRCLYLEQRLLEHHSQFLWDLIKSLIDEDVLPILSNPPAHMSRKELCALHLELFHCLLYYYQHEQAAHHLHMAGELAGISSSLTGVMGKRTRFQQEDVAQLVLEVVATNQEEAEEEEEEEKDVHNQDQLPRDVLLEDDTLLPRVQLSGGQQKNTSLSALQQAVVLAQCIHQQRSNPVHRLVTEVLEAYLECLLSNPLCWGVQSAALFFRSVFQRGRRRTLERSMMQLQELVDVHSKTSPEVKQRLQLFHCLPIPPTWVVEHELATALLSMGAVQSALEVYQRLELWEKVIECYQVAGRHAQAERVVRERMEEEGETPTLWCLLGDTKQDPHCYERAWELSGQRSARAQRSLGLYYLRREKYQESMECLQRSLNINSLQVGLWYSLGCAASVLGDLMLAAKAFRHCVTLEPDNAEAWNNLAGVYVKRKEKERAFAAYQHSIKCSYDNWRIWENFLLVCVDIGEFEEAITAYHRLLDLKQKHVDTEILKHLLEAVLTGMVSRSGSPASNLRKRLGELLGRITAQTTSNAVLWELCARYHLAGSEPVDKEKGLLELQRAQRTARQQPGWDKDWVGVKKVAALTLHYCRVCREQTSDNSGQYLLSAKLAVQSLISTLKQLQYTEEGEGARMVEELITERDLIISLSSTGTTT